MYNRDYAMMDLHRILKYQPPEMCMSKPYIFLAVVISGSSIPIVGIDIYLQHLIDNSKRL
jgi:hypothetical protein